MFTVCRNKCFLLLLVLLIPTLSGCIDKSLKFQVRFAEVSGLKQNDKVYFQRNEIGEVLNVLYTDRGDYLVEIRVEEPFKNAATVDSKFYIGVNNAGQASKAVIVEQDRPGGALLLEGAEVVGSTRTSYLDQLFSELKKRAGDAESEINKALDELQKSLESTSGELDQSLGEAIGSLSLQLDSLVTEFGKIPDSQEVQQLEQSIKQFVEEFMMANKNVQEQIREDLLPKYRQELERLRELLQRQGREQEVEMIENDLRKLEMV